MESADGKRLSSYSEVIWQQNKCTNNPAMLLPALAPAQTQTSMDLCDSKRAN
jgi:hypothetical protein